MLARALDAIPANNDLNLDGVVNVVGTQIVLNAALNLGCSARVGQNGIPMSLTLAYEPYLHN